LLLLPLAVSLFAQERRMLPFFDASTRCVPGPRSPECPAPDEQIGQLPLRPREPAVSVYRLAHKVPGKAKKAWDRATDAAEKGRPEECMEFLDEALAHDADFADALHMRGLFAYQTKDFRRAAELLHRAATLDDANATFLADAAVGQLTVRNPAGAERYARAALRLNPEQRRALEVLNRLKP
jgi:tetratricopeptide (TPR) repeat protein